MGPGAPGLDLARTPIDEAHASARVPFLCTGNRARSQIAEAIVRSGSGGVVEVHSAGSHPKPLHANAVRVLRDELGKQVLALDPSGFVELFQPGS